MAGRPLRPATRRRLGRPSPHQQADRPRAHPQPQKLSTPKDAPQGEYPVLAPVSEGYPKVKGRLLTCYSPVRRSIHPPKEALSHDLHVLSTPPAFVLSQDQTLHQKHEEKPQQQTMSLKTPAPTPQTRGHHKRGQQNNWHWLTNTLLSSQRTSVARSGHDRPGHGRIVGKFRNWQAVRNKPRVASHCLVRCPTGLSPYHTGWPSCNPPVWFGWFVMMTAGPLEERPARLLTSLGNRTRHHG